MTRRDLAAAGLLLGVAAYVRGHTRRRKEAVPVPEDETRRILEDALEPARALYRALRRETGATAEKGILDELPRPLRWIIKRLARLLGREFTDLEGQRLSPAEWMRRVRQILAEHHLAAFMAGQDSEAIPARAWQGLVEVVNAQFEFLKGFKLEVQDEAEFQAGWEARAESYAGAIKVPYWQGRTKVLPLPAMPAQGTPCGNNCGCSWDVKVIDEKKGDYLAYWRRGKQDSCQVCILRERQWSPIRIVNGELL